MTHLTLCARHELLLAVRSRWLQVFAVLFCGLALLVASSGYILSGGYGVQEFARTAESLVQLVLLLVPLTAVTFGALALTPDRGAAELLYSQPISRAVILCGRYLGLLIALSAAQAIGFGLAGLVINDQTGSIGIGTFLIVVATSIALTAVFLSIAALLAQRTAGRTARVLAGALVVWFVSVLLYDLAVLAVASLLRSGTASRVLVTAALVNPVDAARTVTLTLIEGSGAFGAASLALLRLTGGVAATVALAVTSLAVWTIVPLLLAVRSLVRADI
jgi:Cu-processing system permease protein